MAVFVPVLRSWSTCVNVSPLVVSSSLSSSMSVSLTSPRMTTRKVFSESGPKVLKWYFCSDR